MHVQRLTQGPLRRAQFGQSLTISHSLTHRFTLSGEVWHFTQPFLRGSAVGNLWALSYAPRKTLVLDVGFNRGFTDTSTHWEAFIGSPICFPTALGWLRLEFRRRRRGLGLARIEGDGSLDRPIPAQKQMLLSA